MWAVLNVIWTFVNFICCAVNCVACIENEASEEKPTRRRADQSLSALIYRSRFALILGLLVVWLTGLTYMMLFGVASPPPGAPGAPGAPDAASGSGPGGNEDVLAPLRSGPKPSRFAANFAAQPERVDAVRKAFLHGWTGYETYAFGADELLPLSMKSADPWGGMSATMIDGLDTLYLLGFEEQFQRAVDWMKENLSFEKDFNVSFFETSIRVLGGLLSSYELSTEPFLLKAAEKIGTRLMPAFNSPSGIPYGLVNLKSGKTGNLRWTNHRAILSEIGSVQLEFKTLSYHTNNPLFAAKADHVYDLLVDFPFDDENIGKIYTRGLYPVYFQIDKLPSEASFDKNGFVTMGGLSDSFYEYLLKRWLLTNGTVAKYRTMYEESVDAMSSQLLGRSQPSNLLYVGERKNGNLNPKMEHLACFVPGMLALGVMTGRAADPQSTQRGPLLMAIAEELAATCWQMYKRSPSGLAPESVKLSTSKGSSASTEMTSEQHFYILRPEAIESFMVLFRMTGNPQYREWGWEIFQAIERHCRTPAAYGTVKDVRRADPEINDSLQTFFFAETLKYLYLLFSERDVLSLDKYVFNTEAHPFRIKPNERLSADPQD